MGLRMNSKDYSMPLVGLQSPCEIAEHTIDASDSKCIAASRAVEGDRNRLWHAIRQNAEQLAVAEPRLARRLHATIIEQVTPADMLINVLARRLACEDMSRAELVDCISEALSDDTTIIENATRDITAVKERDPSCPHHLHVLLNLKGFHALQTYRISHYFWHKQRHELAYALANLASCAFDVDIHPAAQIGGSVMLDHGTGIVIGETAVVHDEVSILQNVTLGGTGKMRGDRHPKIHSGVMIGAGAKILGNIEIGTMCKIAAGSVVLKNVPPYSTVAGVPARVVRTSHIGDFPAIEMQQAI
jgi:serine O-acetyltransferase